MGGPMDMPQPDGTGIDFPNSVVMFYTLHELNETLRDAVMDQSCDATCTWVPSMSVSFLHCGQRNGYIVYRGAMGCRDLYEFSDGLYESFEQWQDANPCPP